MGAHALQAKDNFFWLKMQETVQNFVRACTKCRKSKPEIQYTRARMQPIQVSEPFVFWTLDYMGPLRETSKVNKHILVLMDHLT